jgi:hypothetical protein
MIDSAIKVTTTISTIATRSLIGSSGRTYRVLTSWKSGSIFALTGPPPQTLGRA